MPASECISLSFAPCNKLWLENCGCGHATNNYRRYRESITLIPHVVCLHLSAPNNHRLAKHARTHWELPVRCAWDEGGGKNDKHVYYVTCRLGKKQHTLHRGSSSLSMCTAYVLHIAGGRAASENVYLNSHLQDALIDALPPPPPPTEQTVPLRRENEDGRWWVYSTQHQQNKVVKRVHLQPYFFIRSLLLLPKSPLICSKIIA